MPTPVPTRVSTNSLFLVPNTPETTTTTTDKSVPIEFLTKPPSAKSVLSALPKGQTMAGTSTEDLKIIGEDKGGRFSLKLQVEAYKELQLRASKGGKEGTDAKKALKGFVFTFNQNDIQNFTRKDLLSLQSTTLEGLYNLTTDKKFKKQLLAGLMIVDSARGLMISTRDHLELQ